MSPRFQRSLPPAAFPAAGTHPVAGGAAAVAISRVPRFAVAIVGQPARPEEAATDTRGALCETLTQIVDTFTARERNPQPPAPPRVGIRGDRPPAPARVPWRRAPLLTTVRPAVAGP